jgi:hypothetical protein
MNECAADGCNQPITGNDGKTNVGRIAHIEAASPKGPRFNAEMSDDDRRHYNNVILLCQPCHDIIDNKENADKYSVEMLNGWKEVHEAKGKEIHSRKSSLLLKAIKGIAALDVLDVADEVIGIDVFSITEKLEYNAIGRNRYLIEDYRAYHAKLAVLYDELEFQGDFNKESLLRVVRQKYLKIKGKYVGSSDDPLACLRQNADSIFEDVEEQLLEDAGSQQHGVFTEDLCFAVSLIMVDAFMRCKILEEPVR